jgi:beta-glucosidase
VPAIVYTWWLGTKGAEAIADVLFGDYNPSGKLTMSFPKTVGQVPVYYNHYNTGRPASSDSDRNYVSAYIDLNNDPQYPFGYGLSYSTFEYGDLKLSHMELKGNQTLTLSITVTNNSKLAGTEIIQLYIRDKVGSVVRPVKELKAFKRINFVAGETKTISFQVSTNDLKFYNNELKYDWEPGEFEIMVGGNSRDVKKASVIWSRGSNY